MSTLKPLSQENHFFQMSFFDPNTLPETNKFLGKPYSVERIEPGKNGMSKKTSCFHSSPSINQPLFSFFFSSLLLRLLILNFPFLHNSRLSGTMMSKNPVGNNT